MPMSYQLLTSLNCGFILIIELNVRIQCDNNALYSALVTITTVVVSTYRKWCVKEMLPVGMSCLCGSLCTRNSVISVQCSAE